MRATLILPLIFPLALAGCMSGAPTKADISPSRGLSLFAADCAACHGADARGGRGPDLTGLAAANGGAFPHTRVMAQIDGLGRHGVVDAVMPEFGAAGLGDTVIVERDGVATPVPVDLLALAAWLETVQD